MPGHPAPTPPHGLARREPAVKPTQADLRAGARRGGVYQGWRIVAACFVIASVAWTLGLFGASVYLQAVTGVHGWAVAQVSSAITLLFLVSAIVQRAVGRSIDRWGPRPVLLLGTVAITSGVAAIGQVSAPWQLYPVFMLIGLGWSTLSTTGIAATVAPWFDRHQGRSMTLAIMGASIGAIIGTPLILWAIAQGGLAPGLAGVAAFAALLLLPLIGWQLRYRRPADLGLHPDGALAAPHADSTETRAPIANAANRRVLLWSAACSFALGLTVQIGFITHHVALASPQLGAYGAGMLVSATGITAFAGRLVLARIVDKVDVRKLAALILLGQTAALLAIAIWPVAPVLIGASLVYGYGIGHVTTLGPVVIRREFGAAGFGRNYGSAATVIQLTSACGPALLGLLRDTFAGYAAGLAIAALLTLVAAFVLLAGRRLASSTPDHDPPDA